MYCVSLYDNPSLTNIPNIYKSYCWCTIHTFTTSYHLFWNSPENLQGQLRDLVHSYYTTCFDVLGFVLRGRREIILHLSRKVLRYFDVYWGITTFRAPSNRLLG